jgi:hypothetical protein
LIVFQDAGKASLLASSCFSFSPHLLAPNPPFGHPLRIKYHNFVNLMDRLETVLKIALLVLGDDHAGKGGQAINKGHDWDTPVLGWIVPRVWSCRRCNSTILSGFT